MAAVFDHSSSKGSARLVLLAIADAAHESGVLTQYARSQPVLARKANVDVDTVRRSIAALVELGEVEVIAEGHGRASASYRVCLPGIGQTPQIAGTQDAGADPAPREVRPRKLRGQTPQDAGSIIPSLPIEIPSTDTDVRVSHFDAFYRLFPRHEARPAAKRAYESAARKTNHTEITAGLLRWLDYWQADDVDKRHIPLPATWLNNERWNDTPPAGRRLRKRSNNGDDFETAAAAYLKEHS